MKRKRFKKYSNRLTQNIKRKYGKIFKLIFIDFEPNQLQMVLFTSAAFFPFLFVIESCSTKFYSEAMTFAPVFVFIIFFIRTYLVKILSVLKCYTRSKYTLVVYYYIFQIH